MRLWGWIKEKYEQVKEKVQEKIDEVLDWFEDVLGDSKPVDESSSADQVNDVNEILLDYSEKLCTRTGKRLPYSSSAAFRGNDGTAHC